MKGLLDDIKEVAIGLLVTVLVALLTIGGILLGGALFITGLFLLCKQEWLAGLLMTVGPYLLWQLIVGGVGFASYIGPRGGKFRMSGSGRSKVYITRKK